MPQGQNHWIRRRRPPPQVPSPMQSCSRLGCASVFNSDSDLEPHKQRFVHVAPGGAGVPRRLPVQQTRSSSMMTLLAQSLHEPMPSSTCHRLLPVIPLRQAASQRRQTRPNRTRTDDTDDTIARFSSPSLVCGADGGVRKRRKQDYAEARRSST
jgi:hypothetical protein